MPLSQMIHPLGANFNKQAINTLMRTAILRLHDKHFYVTDILHKLETEYAVSLSRGRFDDLFMTRPSRDIVAPLDLFEQVLTVMFGHDPYVLTTNELIQLLIAMRVPLDQLQRYTKYGTRQEWHKHINTLVLQSLQPNTLFFGREELLNSMLQTLVTHQYIELTGERGIGKTSLALELMKHYRTTTTNSYYIDGSAITSIATLFGAIAQAVGVKSLGQEPVELRLGVVLQHKPHLVVIDNVVEPSLFSRATIITQFQQKFPQIKLVITSQHYTNATHSSKELVHYEVPPLTYDTIDTPAAKLFQQIFYARHNITISEAQLLYICQQTAGNPMQISMYANTLAIHYVSGGNEGITQQFYENLTPSELQLITLLMIFPTAMNSTFFHYVAFHAFDFAQSPRDQLIQDLIQRKIVIQLAATNQYTIHDELRQLFRQVLNPSQITIVVDQIVHIFMCDTIIWDSDKQHRAFNFTAKEYIQLLAFIDYLIMHSLAHSATSLLVTWHRLLIRYGLASETIVLLERTHSATLPTALVPVYHLTMATLYAERGMFETALTCLTDARDMLPPDQALLLSAQIDIQNAAISLNYLTHDDLPLFAQLTNTLNSHIAILHTPTSTYVLTGVYNQLAHIHFHMGNFTESLEYNRLEIALLRSIKSSFMLTEALNNRSLILMMIGHISIARDTVTDAIDQYIRYEMPLRIAQAQLRLALIALYMNDISAAQHALHVAIMPIIQFGNLKDILYFLDLHIGLLVHLKLYQDGVILYQLATQFRTERNVSRGAVFERALATPLAVAAANLPPYPITAGFILHDTLDFYDTLVALRDKFHYAALFAVQTPLPSN